MEKTSIDYNGLFSHVEDLRKVLLVGTGRAGTDFFQSLLDGHSQILQFTGSWFFHPWWKGAVCKQNLSDLINEFIWCTYLAPSHIAKFKSYYNKIERWDQLGKTKDEFFEVDIDTFKDHMLNILHGRELSSRNFFLAVNLAYGLATGVDIKKTKVLFYHVHQKERLWEFKEDFADFDVICTIREPRNTLVSGVEHWKRYDASMYNPDFLYVLIKRILDESEPIRQYTRHLKTLKLEDTHLFSREVMDEFCRMYGLEFEEGMLESSFHGKRWWGDKLSGKDLGGFNKDIRNEKWRDKLFSHDNLLIEFILQDRLRHYGYPVDKKMSGLYSILAIPLVLLPMRYELQILAHGLKENRPFRRKIKVLSKSIFNYMLRCLLYFRYLRKSSMKKIYLSDFFVQRRYR